MLLNIPSGLLLVGLLQAVASLRLKELTGPKFPDRGENVHLVCNFDTGDAKLYSVKWYKDENEFFRYMPDQRPPTQLFPLEGVLLEESLSGIDHVTLRDVTYDTSGSYRCEVSTEAPNFETVFSNHNMSVLSYPQDDPHLVAAQDVYSSGELVLVNCSAPPTYPPPNITFYINNDKTEEWLLERGPETPHEDGTRSTWTALRFHAERQHFLPPEDVLEVRCDVAAPPLPSSSVRTHLYLATPHSSPNQKLAQKTYRNHGRAVVVPGNMILLAVLLFCL
ncbi:uncharacterized protein LOC128992153 [Macrosteles quadrilineatus]|uniref:uncharacterized protein LOC128992153 n=1 Tax=Macrosteles quadrilineatus TaxID=74068 RepID=UPI0023E11C44|nr:uncharacterized protein LOC128992153 [Macrosteles quadrilineatus]